MKKRINNVFLLLLFITVGLLVTVVLKQDVKNDIPLSIERIDNLNRELEVSKNKIKVNNEIIEKLNLEIEEKEKLTDEEYLKEFLNEEIYRLEILSAEKNLKGKGIIIELNDASDEAFAYSKLGIIHDIDILILLNELRAIGVDAISINDVRVCADSEIECLGPTVRIDNISKATPFIIRVLGDSEKLYAGMTDKNSYLHLLESVYKINVKIYKWDNVQIPKRIRRGKWQ